MPKTITIDPHNTLSERDEDIYYTYAGFIPSFISKGLSYDDMVKDTMKNYGFQTPPMTGHSIDENLVMSYPGDPDMYPMVIIKTCDAQVIIYKYGVTTFMSDDGTKNITYRMD